MTKPTARTRKIQGPRRKRPQRRALQLALDLFAPRYADHLTIAEIRASTDAGSSSPAPTALEKHGTGDGATSPKRGKNAYES